MRFRPSQSSRSDEPRCARPCRFEFEVFVQVSRRRVRKVEGLFGQAKAKKRRRKKKDSPRRPGACSIPTPRSAAS